MRVFLIAMAIALGGCASKNSAYTRTDGVAVDPLHQQVTLTQCKGEAATAPIGPEYHAAREKAVIAACMARNGYIQAQQ
jgi:hypothetical protein